MVTFKVNGKDISVNENTNRSLMNYLREELKLTSVKDGCSEGACGTCTIIIDGKTTKSCVRTLEKVNGSEILTVEGLSDKEKEIFDFAFGDAGAVQCGFCIPGMVICAKALIDTNDNPTKAEVKKAINGNICRCTGYQKIEEAILLAAKIIRENKGIPKKEYTSKFGGVNKRVDAKVKTLGTGIYADDLYFDDMVYGKALRPPAPRVTINALNLEKALAHGDCVSIITKDQIPGKKVIGHLKQDQEVLVGVGETTRYIGDAICLVVSTKQESLSEILNLIELDYTELKPITSPKEALANGADHILEGGNILSVTELKRGNPHEEIEKAKYKVTKTYNVPFTEHAFLEPECCVAMPYEDGVFVHTGGQGIYDEQHEIAHMLGLDYDKVVIESKLVGGGFGGKEDMSVQHHGALIAYLLKKTVKVKLTRQESINTHPKRHAMEIEVTSACDENGKLTALVANILSDTGAYASLGGPVLERACTHAAGPYNYHNVHIKGTAVYTNNPPGGAFRGFGVCQSNFAVEANINHLAEMVGISAYEMRHINAIRPGQALPNGQIADESTALIECLEAVKDVYENNKYTGLALAFKNSGVGVGIPDTGRCILCYEDGKVHIRTSGADIGQGLQTVVYQIVGETLDIDESKIFVEPPNTIRTPNSGTTTASRQTVFTGEACKRASMEMKKALDSGKTLDDLLGKEFYGEYTSETDPIGSDKENPVSHVAYGYGAHVVILDDEGKISEVVAAHDVGTVINRTSVEGQIDGGVVMGLGYALTEDFPLEESVPKAKFGTLGLFRANNAPKVTSIIVNREFEGQLAYGAKGIGEISTVPTAAAVQQAYYKFDGNFRTRLPLEKTAYRKK
ncbi:MAG: selenium-dependent xanthine dehydrogenase [Lachnospirales bacterium]